MKITISKSQWGDIGLQCGWIKEATSQQYLDIINVPQRNSKMFLDYLNKLPKKQQQFVLNRLKNNPNMSMEELQQISSSFMVKNSIEIPPEYEKIILNIAESKEERNWLRNLYEIGRFKLEDGIKLSNLIKKFNKAPNGKKISDFKDDVELSEFLSEHSDDDENYENIEDIDIPSGAEILSKDGDISAISITDQNALDELGAGASWCVLSENGAYEYEPFDYIMFLEGAEPIALCHEGSSQFKDQHDGPIGDNTDTVFKIANIVEKLNMGLEQYEGFNTTLEEINKIYERVKGGDKDFGKSIIDEGKTRFIPKDSYNDYAEYILTQKSFDFTDINYDFLSFLIDYSKVYSMPDSFNVIESQFIEKIKKEPLTTGRMRKTIPQGLRTKNLLDANLRGWIRKVKLNPYDFKYVPEELKNDPEIKEAIKIGWIEKINYDPRSYKKCPKELKNDHDIYETLINSWVQQIEDPRKGGFQDAPNELVNHPKLKDMLIKRWAKLLTGDYNALNVPESFKNDPQIKEAIKNGLIGHIAERYDIAPNKHSIPEEFKNDPDVKKALLSKWARYIKGHPSWYRVVPEEFKTDSTIKQSLFEGWIGNIKNYYKNNGFTWDNYNNIPEGLKNDPRIKTSLVNAIFENEVFENDNSTIRRLYNETIPEEFKNDHEVKEKIANRFAKNIDAYFTNSDKSTTKFSSYYDVPEEFKNYPEIKEAIFNLLSKIVKSQPDSYKKIPEEWKNNPTIKDTAIVSYTQVLKENPHMYDNVPEELKNDPRIQNAYFEGRLNHLSKYPSHDQNMSEEYKNDPRVENARINGWINYLLKYPDDIEKVPEKWKNDPRIQKAYFNGWVNRVKENRFHYQYVPEEFKNAFEVKEAQTISWADAIKEEANRKYGIRVESVSINEIPEDIKNDPRIQKEILNLWINYAKEKKSEYEIIPEEFKNDPRIKEAYIDGRVRFFNECEYDSKLLVADEFKNEPRIKETYYNLLLRMIKKNPVNYISIPEEFKNNPTLKELAKEEWVRLLSDDKNRYYYLDKIPDEFKNEPRILQVLSNESKNQISQKALSNDKNRLFSSVFNNNYIGNLSFL